MKRMLQGSPCPAQKVYRKNPVWTGNLPTHFINSTFPLHSTLAPPCPSLHRRVNRYLLAHVVIVTVSYRVDTSVILSTKGRLLLWEIFKWSCDKHAIQVERSELCIYIICSRYVCSFRCVSTIESTEIPIYLQDMLHSNKYYNIVQVYFINFTVPLHLFLHAFQNLPKALPGCCAIVEAMLSLPFILANGSPRFCCGFVLFIDMPIKFCMIESMSLDEGCSSKAGLKFRNVVA